MTSSMLPVTGVTTPELHFLESPQWGDFQAGLGRTVVREMGEGWSAQAIVERGRINSRLYVPYGPVLEGPAALPAAIAALKLRARSLGAAFLRVEPTGDISPGEIAASGARRVHHVQPDLTWRIDLRRDLDEILGDMTKTSRNLYRNYAKKGLSIRCSSDPAEIEIFIALLSQVAQHNGIQPHPPDYFRAQAQALIPSGHAALYFVEVSDGPVAAALVYDDQQRRYYAHAASDYAHRSLHPGNVLVTQLIVDAWKQKQAQFDFYGVAPSDQTDHPWAGFSRFKRSFGGFDHAFAGTWEYPVSRPGYIAYRLMRRMLG